MSHPAFTPPPQRITAPLPVLICRPTEVMRLFSHYATKGLFTPLHCVATQCSSVNKPLVAK